MTLICAIVHLVGAVQFTFAVFYDWTKVKIPPSVQEMGSGFGGKLVYLTFWDAVRISPNLSLPWGSCGSCGGPNEWE